VWAARWARGEERSEMNRGFLIIAIPAFLVSIFWLTLGWGWHTAVIGGCLEIAIGVGGVVYAARRSSAAHGPGPGGPDAGR
jgi:hypothetical protein